MKKNLYSITVLLSTVFSIFLCQAMNPPRPTDKTWTERAGKALARTGRFAYDEWWQGSHVPSIIAECEKERFNRDLTEKDGRLNVSNFESALIDLTQKRKAEELTFILEKGLKMKAFKDSTYATILKEINTQRLNEARDIISKKEATIADTTVAEINTIIADRARQMDEMRRLQRLIDNQFVETDSNGDLTPAKMVILQKLQQSPQFCSPLTSSSSSSSPSAAFVAATTQSATLSSSSSPAISSAHSHTAPVISSSSSCPSTKSLLAAATAAALISTSSPSSTMPSFSSTSALSTGARPFTPSISPTPSQKNLSQSQESSNNDGDDTGY